jgi:hypothetical protein
MKTPLLVGVALTLLAAVSLSPAMAQGPQLSAGSSWPGVPPHASIPVLRLVSQQPRITSCNTATTNTRGGGVTGCWSGNR